MDWQRLVIGDWNPVVRDPIDVARIGYLVAFAAYAASGGGGLQGLTITTASVVLVRLLALPRPYDASFVLAMTLIGWGEALRLYDRFSFYDVIVHALVPLLGAPVVYVFLARLDVVPDPADDTNLRHYAGIFVVTLALGLALGGLWEMLEFSSDRVFGSQLQLGLDDTMADLAADFGGAVVGAILLLVWAIYGWGTVRRASGRPHGPELRQAREQAGDD